ncbi:hypothetical protein MNBD_DELTA04-1683 [hydrothermal vent metagenome]|uniref:Lcl C-terminal domain-containing protein n=1 Tax=hydrothermal vent metagenome TaxID=652676 RepID=A0A3B0VN57_9ZZZZ
MTRQSLVTIILVLFLLVTLPGCAKLTKKGKSGFVNLGNGICLNRATGQMWQIKRSKMISGLKAARAYVVQLNKTSKYHDWRLPTVYELYDLIFTFDIHRNGNCVIENKGKYWADKKNGEGMVGAWELGPECGIDRHYYSGGGKGYVRAVRP